MVWHAYMLNPRCFLEDCYRLGKLDFYATPFPWTVIDNCIDANNFTFNAPTQARTAFEEATALKWDSLDDSSQTIVICPMCDATNSVPWTREFYWDIETHQIDPGTGLADSDFTQKCERCNFRIDHDTLRAQKFRNDVQRLLEKGVPMPGTVLAPQGQPREHETMRAINFAQPPASMVPNETLIKPVGTTIISSKDW